MLSRLFIGFFFFVYGLAFCPLRAAACPDIDGLVDVNCDRQVIILCFGDSITRGVADSTRLGYPGRLQQLLPNTTVYSLGVPGEETFQGRSRAPHEFNRRSNADYIVILEGVNDYWIPNRSSFATRSNLLSMVSSADRVGAITLLGRLTPVTNGYQNSWVSSVNSAIAPYTDVDFFSLGSGIISSDRLHPDGLGYQAMAALLVSALDRQADLNRPRDRDNDGIYDFAETMFGSDRDNPDSDADGLIDGIEVFTYGSSPILLDSDNDGLSDTVEVQSLGTNPADPRPSAPFLAEFELLPRQ